MQECKLKRQRPRPVLPVTAFWTKHPVVHVSSRSILENCKIVVLKQKKQSIVVNYAVDMLGAPVCARSREYFFLNTT